MIWLPESPLPNEISFLNKQKTIFSLFNEKFQPVYGDFASLRKKTNRKKELEAE